MPDETAAEISGLFAEFNTKISSIEERHDMLKERLLLVSQSFLRQEERVGKEMSLLKEELRELRMDIDRMNENIQHLIRDSAEFARREELTVIEKYLKLWEPLKFVKEDEVKKMINDKLKK